MFMLRWVPFIEHPKWCLDGQRVIFEFLTSSDLYTLQVVNKRTYDAVYIYALHLCKKMNNPMVLSCISINVLNTQENNTKQRICFTSGSNHSLLANEYGEVFGQGSNYFGQLGTGDRTMVNGSHSWIVANIPRYCHTIRKLLAGDRSSFLLTSTGIKDFEKVSVQF